VRDCASGAGPAHGAAAAAGGVVPDISDGPDCDKRVTPMTITELVTLDLAGLAQRLASAMVLGAGVVMVCIALYVKARQDEW
jgi:hypothetical protein